jgi:DNA-binding LytR/AlgR family response regulator
MWKYKIKDEKEVLEYAIKKIESVENSTDAFYFHMAWETAAVLVNRIHELESKLLELKFLR